MSVSGLLIRCKSKC